MQIAKYLTYPNLDLKFYANLYFSKYKQNKVVRILLSFNTFVVPSESPPLSCGIDPPSDPSI